jgi:hypothetical protein
MIAKVLTFYDFTHLRAAQRARVSAYSRGASFPRGPDTRQIPRSRSLLECRWQTDPATGALAARWVDPSADAGAGATVKSENVEARRCLYQSSRAALGPAVTRLAA